MKAFVLRTAAVPSPTRQSWRRRECLLLRTGHGEDVESPLARFPIPSSPGQATTTSVLHHSEHSEDSVDAGGTIRAMGEGVEDASLKIS